MSDRADTSAAPPASWSEQDGLVQCGPILQTGDITELAASLAKFQGDVTGAAKAGANPHFRSSYARLEDAWGAAREALAEHGLSVTQWPDAAESGWLAVSTRIMHSSGQWLQSTLTLPLDTTGSKNPAQQYGSTQTYAQRYAFMAALGLPPVDDDAQHAGEQKPSKGPKKRTKKGKAAPGAEVTAWSERLTSCTTMDELAKAWAAVNKVKGGFSAGQLAGLKKDKDDSKALIEKGGEVAGDLPPWADGKPPEKDPDTGEAVPPPREQIMCFACGKVPVLIAGENCPDCGPR